jgi:prephenate dehydrogenase
LKDSTVAIVGLGLMGGSMALALRVQNACQKIFGVTRNPQARAAALARGAVDTAGPDLDLAAEADVVILATPVRTILDQLPSVGQAAREGAIVMDLGSTKCAIVQAMEDLPLHIEPIGAHPMCGKETSGFDSADASLYRNAPFILTPLERTSPQTLALAESLARAIGARSIVLDAVRHDRIVAAISHLPFALAASLMMYADELARADDLIYTLAASGFRDTSRLAAGDTTMMLDILLTNHGNVADAVRAYSRHMAELAKLIDRQDEAALRAVLQDAAFDCRWVATRPSDSSRSNNSKACLCWLDAKRVAAGRLDCSPKAGAVSDRQPA